jgi:gag-polypeptide of LTR copia-type
VANALNKKYAPKDRISRVEMKRQLTAVSMSKKEDPHKMFEEFHRLSNLFNDGNVKISDEDLMAQVFLAAPDHYQSVLNSESRSRGNNLSLTDLEEAMTQLWKATYGKGGGHKQDDAKDIVMAAPVTWRPPQRNNNWRGSGSNWRGGRGRYGNNNGGRGKPRAN